MNENCIPKKRMSIELVATSVLAVLVLSSPTALAQPGQQPNVLLIVSDDHGYNDVASYGATDALTPHMDSLGSNGIRFSSFYVSPVCTPSRFCLMTGLHVNRSQDDLWDVVLYNEPGRGIHEDKTTLAEIFRDNGYQTAVIGKWHLGQGNMQGDPPPYEYVPEEFHPQNHGFDLFYGHLGGMINYNTHQCNTGVLDWQRNTLRLPEEDNQYSTHLITSNAVAYIDEHAADPSPFFLYLAYNAPHRGTGDVDLPPNEETERFYLSRFDFTGLPDTDVRKRHLARIAAMDDGIGEVMNALQTNGIEENTVVLFISDNGGKLSIGGENTPLRGEKNTFWEGGIRVPAMVQWTGTIVPGQVSDQVIQHVDLPLTLISLLGLSADEYATDGLDLHEQFLGASDFDRDLFYYIPGEAEVLRYGNWKYIRLNDGADELYDLENDIGETANLAGSQPGVLANLKARFDAQKAALDPPSSSGNAVPESPDFLFMDQNFPNPFNPQTTIRFGLPAPAIVSILVYDLRGREIRTLLNEHRDSGFYELTWNGTDDRGRNVSSGVYYLRVKAGGFQETRKLTVIK